MDKQIIGSVALLKNNTYEHTYYIDTSENQENGKSDRWKWCGEIYKFNNNIQWNNISYTNSDSPTQQLII